MFSIKKLIVIALCLALAAPAGAAAPDSVRVFIGDERVDRFGASFTLGSEIYVPISDVALAYGAECSAFNERTGSAEVYAKGLRISAVVGDRYLTANGRLVYCPRGVLFRYNRVMVPAEALAGCYGASLEYDKDAEKLCFSAAGELISPAEWSDEDLKWLGRIVSAEARGESLEGKIAVANVVLNRVKSDDYPDSVKEVVFDRRFGVQFSPVSDGTIYNEPTEESLLAAILALDGASVAGESLFFVSEAAAKYCWAERNRTRYGKFDHQVFYL